MCAYLVGESRRKPGSGFLSLALSGRPGPGGRVGGLAGSAAFRSVCEYNRAEMRPVG